MYITGHLFKSSEACQSPFLQFRFHFIGIVIVTFHKSNISHKICLTVSSLSFNCQALPLVLIHFDFAIIFFELKSEVHSIFVFKFVGFQKESDSLFRVGLISMQNVSNYFEICNLFFISKFQKKKTETLSLSMTLT